MIRSYGLADLEFEWHDDKAEFNEEKHGFGFREGAEVFLDPHRTIVGTRTIEAGEVRHAVVGSVGQNLVLLVFTMRGHRIHIISVRKAHRNERKKYRGLQA